MNRTTKSLFLSLLVVLASAVVVKAQVSSALPRLHIGTWQQMEIDRLVAESIRRGNMPGCVVAIGDQSGIEFLKAYGNRQVVPSVEPMTKETLFDLASLTKPIATATSIMKLVELRKIRLDDPVAKHWPEFGAKGKDKITIEQLLTHQGGLIPDNHLRDYEEGPGKAMENICQLKLISEPGTKFAYTDVGFIVLAEVVRKVSGKDIATFALEEIYQPLDMQHTRFGSAEGVMINAATTEKVGGEWLKGKVHDPRAARLNGVAGHAGLFSRATDLSRFARTLLGRGQLDQVQILKPETVGLMTGRIKTSSGFRTLGWDSLSGYSSNRGNLFSKSAFGHGGFTGTSFWVDPELNLFVVFLSNRLHPDGKGSVNSLAGKIGTIAAASRLDDLVEFSPITSPVQTGIDVLLENNLELIHGPRVGLITNQTGISIDGTRTSKLLDSDPDVNLVALFSPEHGLEGKLDQSEILDTKDDETGVKVFSLYGEHRAPTAESLKDIDLLVFDIQDVGSRFYTYISTMGLAMEACNRHGVKFMVLDRPNPINGIDVEGPGIDEGQENFVAFHNLSIRHGMTVGELAQMFKAERGLDQLELSVVRMKGWERSAYFDQTGLRWVNPSPNMRSLNQAVLYPGIGLLETTNLSVGRGTDTPFEIIGSPWINEIELAAELNGKRMSGVRFVPIRFTPQSSKYRNESCRGVNIIVTDRNKFQPIEVGFHIARVLANHYSNEWNLKNYNTLLKNRLIHQRLTTAKATDPSFRVTSSSEDFLKRREKYLLYD